MKNHWISINEAAAITEYSKGHIRRLLRMGFLQGEKINGRWIVKLQEEAHGSLATGPWVLAKTVSPAHSKDVLVYYSPMSNTGQNYFIGCYKIKDKEWRVYMGDEISTLPPTYYAEIATPPRTPT